MDEAERFGDFRLLRRVHVGVMAEAWRADGATGPLAGRALLLKRALPTTAEDPARRARFAAEAALAGRLRGPHLLTALASGEHRGLPWYACAWIRGWTAALVRDHAASGRGLPPPLVAALGAGVASGLAALHTLADPAGRPLGLVHQDVTPGNVLLAAGGAVVLADVGAAVRADRADEPFARLATPGYEAPEQLARGALTPRTDLWQLGLLLAELVAGARGGAAVAAVQARRGPLLTLVGDLLRPDPERRPPGAAPVAAALAALTDVEGAHRLARWARANLPPPAS